MWAWVRHPSEREQIWLGRQNHQWAWRRRSEASAKGISLCCYHFMTDFQARIEREHKTRRSLDAHFGRFVLKLFVKTLRKKRPTVSTRMTKCRGGPVWQVARRLCCRGGSCALCCQWTHQTITRPFLELVTKWKGNLRGAFRRGKQRPFSNGDALWMGQSGRLKKRKAFVQVRKGTGKLGPAVLFWRFKETAEWSEEEEKWAKCNRNWPYLELTESRRQKMQYFGRRDDHSGNWAQWEDSQPKGIQFKQRCTFGSHGQINFLLQQTIMTRKNANGPCGQWSWDRGKQSGFLYIPLLIPKHWLHLHNEHALEIARRKK